MHRFCLALVWLVVGLVPSLALAQTTPGLTVYIAGDQVENSMNLLFFSTQQCEDNVNVRFKITLNQDAVDPNTVRDRPLQMWSVGGSTGCRAASERQDQSGQSDCAQANCSLVTSKTIEGLSDLELTVKAQELFTNDDGDCITGPVSVTLVAVDGANCGMAGEDLLPAEYTATFTVRGEPAAPDSVTVSNGDSSLGVSWKAPNARQTDEFKLYVDTDPGPNCENPLLMAGDSAEMADGNAMMDEIRTFTASGRSSSLSTANLGLDIGDYAAVFVATVDTQANIQGPLSEMGCGERISTEGPLGAIERETGKEIQSCSSAGGRDALGGSAALMGLLGLWLLRRRRESHA